MFACVFSACTGIIIERAVFGRKADDSVALLFFFFFFCSFSFSLIALLIIAEKFRRS